jgi:Ca2+-binding EF-hand superfamily protein
MRTLAIATALALGFGSVALAQMKSPSPPAASTDAAAEAKFKSADKNNNGALDGAELEAHRAVMAQVDTDKDGKISRTEFLAGTKAGHIK